MVTRFFKKFYLAVIFIFLYAPILVLIAYSFNDSRTRGTWSGFTLKWYIDMFNDEQILTSLYYTIIIGLL